MRLNRSRVATLRARGFLFCQCGEIASGYVLRNNIDQVGYCSCLIIGMSITIITYFFNETNYSRCMYRSLTFLAFIKHEYITIYVCTKRLSHMQQGRAPEFRWWGVNYIFETLALTEELA